MSQTGKPSINRPAFSRDRVKDMLTVLLGVLCLLVGLTAVGYAGYNVWSAWRYISMADD